MIYRPGEGSPEIRDLLNVDEDAMLKVLQDSVGGYIEPIPGFSTIQFKGQTYNCVAFRNEQGKLLRLPVNRMATQLWHKALRPLGLVRPDGGIADVLVGNVLVLLGDEEFMAAL